MDPNVRFTKIVIIYVLYMVVNIFGRGVKMDVRSIIHKIGYRDEPGVIDFSTVYSWIFGLPYSYVQLSWGIGVPKLHPCGGAVSFVRTPKGSIDSLRRTLITANNLLNYGARSSPTECNFCVLRKGHVEPDIHTGMYEFNYLLYFLLQEYCEITGCKHLAVLQLLFTIQYKKPFIPFLDQEPKYVKLYKDNLERRLNSSMLSV